MGGKSFRNPEKRAESKTKARSRLRKFVRKNRALKTKKLNSTKSSFQIQFSPRF